MHFPRRLNVGPESMVLVNKARGAIVAFIDLAGFDHCDTAFV